MLSYVAQPETSVPPRTVNPSAVPPWAPGCRGCAAQLRGRALHRRADVQHSQGGSVLAEP